MLLLAAVLYFCGPVASSSPRSYSNYSLLSVVCSNNDQVQALEAIQSQEVETGTFGVEMWQPPVIGQRTDVLVKPSCLEDFLRDLAQHGIPYEMKVRDIGKLLESEVASRQRKDGMEKFMTLKEMEMYLHDLASNYPSVVAIEKIGGSFENRSILVAKLSSPPSDQKRVIWIDAGIHAREWIAPASALHIVTKLLTENSMRKYLESFDWHILPVLNPDGYHFTHTQDRMWRKNRRRGPCKCFIWAKFCCDGVDLNRNFDYEWGGTGSSKNPCDSTYRGSAAFSEPESAAVRDYLLSIANRTLLYLTLHSYGQFWVYPFSDRSSLYSEDFEELDRLAKNATAALESLYGSKYRVGTAADIMYPTTGSSADWVKSVARVKYVYGIELRPGNEKRRAATGGFIVPPHEIRQSGDELWAAISALIDGMA